MLERWLEGELLKASGGLLLLALVFLLVIFRFRNRLVIGCRVGCRLWKEGLLLDLTCSRRRGQGEERLWNLSNRTAIRLLPLYKFVGLNFYGWNWIR